MDDLTRDDIVERLADAKFAVQAAARAEGHARGAEMREARERMIRWQTALEEWDADHAAGGDL